MQIDTTIQDIRSRVRQWQAAGERVALVPTMGNLHEGHLRLVDRARELADRVVVSIFVNPIQFGPGEDLDSYPRTESQDADKLRERGADLLFLPDEAELYPNGREGLTLVHVPGLTEELCGASRPGHFDGVTTVVAKLFHIVGPDVAVFGRKDYQQLAVIRRMVSDLDFPAAIEGAPTVREADGLAMSSRNAYLDADQRRRAPRLYETLQAAARQLEQGREPAGVENDALQALEAAGFEPEYVSVRRAHDLSPAGADDRQLVILAAARLGKARLIDNLEVELPG